MLQVPASAEFGFQHACSEPITVAPALHHRAARGAFAAHEQGDAQHALVAYDRDLRRGSVMHDVEQGHDAVGGEIHISLMTAGFVERPAEFQWNLFQMGQQALVVRCRQCSEKEVPPGRLGF